MRIPSGSTLMISICLLCCLVATGALAQQTSVNYSLAKKHYELGEQYYRAADYQRALDAFNESYRLEPLAALLYNIGRCHEGLNHLEQAVHFFRLYLEKNPDSKERDVLKLRIQNIESRLEREREDKERQQEQIAKQPTRQPALRPAVQNSPPPLRPAAMSPATDSAASDPGTEASVTKQDTAPMPWRKPVGWATLGVGGATIITGIIFGAMVSSKSSEHETAVKENRTWDELQEITDSGERYEKLEIATLIAGSVIAAAGGGLLLWHWLDGRKEAPAESESESAWLTPLVTDNEVGLLFHTRF